MRLAVRPRTLALAVGACFLVFIGVTTALGIQISDPTEGGQAVRLVNNLGQTVRLTLCTDQRCQSTTDGPTTLRPSQTLSETIQSDSDVPFLLELPSGARATCQMLHVGAIVQASYGISQLRPCGR